MTRSRCTEEQIGPAVRQAEAGTPAAEVRRTLGVRAQPFSRWQRQRPVEDETRQLQPLVADLRLATPLRHEARRTNG